MSLINRDRIVQGVSVPHLSEPPDLVNMPDLTEEVIVPDPNPIFMGTYSYIYRGKCRGQEVAIKVLRVVSTSSSSMRRKMKREQEIWSHLEHPNITPMYGYTEPSKLFGTLGAFISPWYEYGDCAKYLRQHGPSLTMDERYTLWKGVVAGVAYLHNNDPVIIHGDLKPSNVLIDDDGNPRICDFGLGHILLEDAHSGMTTTTQHTGTERYLAPEFVTADATPTVASDVFALGCMGLEHPYNHIRHNRKGTIVKEIMKGTPPAVRPPDVAPDMVIVWDILEACWHPIPSMRISTALILSNTEQTLEPEPSIIATNYDGRESRVYTETHHAL